jgi:excisionase family DNA binding protein
MTSHERHLSIAEAANRCEVSTRSVYRWIKDKQLAVIRLPSGRMRVAIDDLERFLTPRVDEEVAA